MTEAIFICTDHGRGLADIVICPTHDFSHLNIIFTCPFCAREARNLSYQQQKEQAEKALATLKTTIASKTTTV